MPLLVSNAQFNINTVDLYWYSQYEDDSLLEKNANVTLNGQTYPDLFWVDGYDGYDYLELAFLGSGLTQSSSGAITGGTVNVVAEFDLFTDELLWYTQGVSISAAAIYNAALTPSNLDELNLIQTALAGDDTILMSAFDDVANGFGGNDLMTGGAGNDTLSGGDGNDELVGDQGNDILNGGAGDDALDGRQGNDYLDGGTGTDRAVYSSASGAVVVSLAVAGAQDTGDGLDTLVSIEGLVGSAFGDGLVGNDSANTILGGGGEDQIFGQGGNDVLQGGDGNDHIEGGDGTDTLSGDAGDDWLEGGAGLDNVTGGSGNDTYVIAATVAISGDGSGYAFGEIDQVTEAAGGGMDTVITNSSYTLGANVENLELVGDLDTSGFGNALDNRIIGNEGDNFIQGQDGNDYLDGGAGGDHLIGGNGDDTYVIDSQFDVIGPESPDGAGGVDTVISGIDFGLEYSLDHLTLTGAAIMGTGNHRDNVIIGNAEGNTLHGQGGNDIIRGEGGADTLIGGFGNDVLTGGAGIDTLTGHPGLDEFRDTVAGLDGDTITDLSVGETIVLTNASLAGFSFGMNGSTLNFTGGSVTLQGVSNGNFAASAAAGGVALTLVSIDEEAVRNDFNGDGRSDILWRSDDGHLSNWLGTESGGWLTNDANAFTFVSPAWRIAATGDFNGDGRADIIWRSDDGGFSNWLATPGGGFVNNDANAFATVPVSWDVAGTGDFNGDGHDDVLWRNSNGQLSNWLGTESGGFTNNDANAFASAPTDWHVVGTGDFNGDGNDDILWRSDSGALSNWLGTDSGGFVTNDANAFSTVATSWHVFGTGDFNGDGFDDILWRSDYGELSNWLGTESGGFVNNDANAFANVPVNWVINAVGDYNGDGFDDILWRNDAGQLSNWLGTETGGFIVNDGNALTDVSAFWQVQPPIGFL